MNIKKLLVVPVLLISFAFASAPALAVELHNKSLPSIESHIPGELAFPGTIRDTAKSFKITNSDYLNISVDSTEIIEVHIESIPNMILMHLESSTTVVSSIITISNLEPNTTYWWHQDTHRSSTPFTTDTAGSYSYTQDLSERHLVFIKPKPSTKYISDNSTGGDCTTIGTWNNTTKTCTLTTNLTETVEIESDGITLDGNGFSIIHTGGIPGSGYGGYGVFVNGYNNLTIKNINISGFSFGIYLINSDYSSINSNIIASNYIGIYFSGDHDSINDNNISNKYWGIISWDYWGASYGTNISLSGNIVNSCATIYVLVGGLTMTKNILDGPPTCLLSFSISGDYDSTGNSIDTTNLIGGLPVYYLEDAHDSVYENAGAFYCIRCDNVILRNSNLQSSDGVVLWRTNNSRVQNVTSNAYTSWGAFNLTHSDNNIIINNDFISDYLAFSLVDSDNNNFLRNTAWGMSGYYSIDINESSNNTFANNNFIDIKPPSINDTGSTGNKFNLDLPIGGNYWSWFDESGEGCDDTDSDKICDDSFSFTYPVTSEDEYPWIMRDAWPKLPIITNLTQNKSDLQTPLSNGTTTESWSDNPTKGIISLSAKVFDQENDPVKLQIEIKQVGQSFNGLDTIENPAFLPSDSKISITKDNLSPGQYKWRAKGVDVKGDMSPWQHFGDSSDTADFTVKLVPLYTQVSSQYPSFAATDTWFEEEYASGYTEEYYCGSTIAECGCAMVSLVMLSRYHNLDIEDYEDIVINPFILNNWLKSITLGYDKGNVNWPIVQKYSESVDDFVKLKYDGAIKSKDITKLNEYVADNNNPVVVQVPGHFLVIDGKLGDTYTVKDPHWFETTSLNQLAINSDQRSYNNNFSSLRLYTAAPTATTAAPSISGTLASPAEFLVTAPDGKKLGKDPINGLEYTEITDGVYYEEGIGNPEDISADYHKVKRIWIPDPIDGQYDFKVIGTGEGEYTASSTIFDSNGDSHSESFIGNTKENIITSYDFVYDSTTPTNIDVSPEDQTAPTTTISIAGTQISGWYTSGTLVTLSATDNTSGVGVWKTEYSLDGGTNWITYTDSFTPPDATNLNILYRSEDYVGNVETYGSTTIDVDQTGPEAEIYFDVINGEVVVNGNDNFSTPTVTKIDDENYTITDHVDHTLKVNLIPAQTSPTLTDPGIANIKVVSLQYNSNDPILLPTTDLAYEYSTFPVVSLNESITSLPHLSVTGVYNPIDDTTTISGMADIEPVLETLSGLVVIKLLTNDGGLNFNY